MPYTPEQHRLFEYVAHNPKEAHKKGYDISSKDAAKMAAEGIRKAGKAASEKDGQQS